MNRSFFWLAAAAAGCMSISEVQGAAGDDNNAKSSNTRIETVIVSAPLHKTTAETALPVTVISDEELRARSAGTIGETLNNSPGLASASFGPGVGQPVIRGQQGSRVQVLENSASSGDASGVSADHAVTVEPMLAESIEVLRGPSTLLYGGGAIGGVVNVIDNRIPKQLQDRTTGVIEYRRDSNDDGNASVIKLDGSADSIAWHLDGVYRDWNDIEIPGQAFDRRYVSDLSGSSDGFVANTGGRNSSVAAGASWIFDNGYLGASVNDMANYYGIPNVAGGESGLHIDMRQKRYDVAGEWRDLGRIVDALRWRLTYTDYEHKELEDTGEVGTKFTNQTWQNRLELVHEPILGWHGVVGLQLKRSDFAAVGEESFIPESIGKGVGVFVLEDYHLGDWIYELGLRYDRDSVDPESGFLSEKSFNNLSASAGTIWRFMPRWSLGLSLSRSQRAPTVEELFSNAGNAGDDLVVHGATQSIEVGDANLHQETSRNVDLTLSYKDDRLDGYLTFFHNQFHDYIFLANSGETGVDGDPILFYGQQDARFNGVEFSITTQLAQTRAGSFSADVYGDSVRGELDQDGDVPRLPPWRLGAKLKFDRDTLNAYVGILHAARQSRPGQFETQTDGYNRIDAGVSYSLTAFNERDTQLFLRGTNLTNQTIRASTSFLRNFSPEPGRSVEAGVRFSF